MTNGVRTADDIRTDVERLARELGASLAELDAHDGAQEWKLRSRLLRLEAEYLLANRPEPTLTTGQRVARGFRAVGDFVLKLAPVATPVVIGIIAYLATGTIERALELRKVEVAEQQLDLATIQALQDHFEKLRTPDISAEEAEKLAMLIAAFGLRALLPMIMELDLVEIEEEKRAKALRHALRMMALESHQRDQLCEILLGAISAGLQGAIFRHDGLRIMKELASEIPCQSEKAAAAPLGMGEAPG